MDVKDKGTRIDRDVMFLKIAKVIAERSTCLRAKVGCVVVVGDRIRSTGYGGAPSGEDHCIDVGCELRRVMAPGHEHVGSDGTRFVHRDSSPGHVTEHCVRTVHAESNAITWAAREGLSLEDGILYSTHGPCLDCAKLIINVGIHKIVYLEPYQLDDGVNLLTKAELEVVEVATDWDLSAIESIRS